MYFPRYYWPIAIYTPTIAPLFDAIYNRFAATALAAKITDLYNTMADDEAVMPYGTMSLISDVPDWTFTENFEECLIQFSLFSATSTCEEILEAIAALKSAYDFFDLVVVGFSTVSLERGLGNLTKVEKKWQYIVTYRIEIQND